MIWTLALIGALALGSLMESTAGAVIGAALGFLLGRVLRLQQDVADLRRELRLATAKASPSPAQPPPLPALAMPPTPAPTTPPSLPSSEAPPRTADARVPPQPAEPTLLARALDWLRGGNPLARVGIVILFFGGAFLAKYAAEHSRFPIPLRMTTLALGALTLLAIGWRLRRQRAAYAQTLQGGGIAGLYLTVFASTRLYDLLLPGAALTLLVLIAILAASLAVAQNALALAVIGTAGGFLAPILLATGPGNPVALFSYYTVLNLGVFAVAWFRAWRVLNLVGLVFTFGIVGLFHFHADDAGRQAVTDGFLLLFFLLYVGITLLFALRQTPDLRGYVSGSLVFGLPLATFAIHADIVDPSRDTLAWSAAGFGAFYLALGWGLHRSRRVAFALLSEAFAALGIIFGTLAIPLAFDHRVTTVAWAVEGAGLVWIGLRQQRALARGFGLLLQALGGALFLRDLALAGDHGEVVVGTTMLALSGLLSGRWLHRSRHQGIAHAWEAPAEIVAAVWGLAWWCYGGFDESARWLSAEERSADLGLLAITAAALHTVAGGWPLARRLAAALLPASFAVGVLTQPEHPLAQGAIAGWLLVLAVHYLTLRRDEAADDPLLARLLPWRHAGAFWLLALLMAWELHWQLAQQVPGVWRDLPWGLAPALLLFLCARAADWPGWPLRQHAVCYRQQAAPLLALWTAAWLLAINLHSDGDPGRLRYAPLLNPLDFASLLALAALALWWRLLDAGAAIRNRVPRPVAIWIALVFVWLNAALIRALHYDLDTPLTLYGALRSTLVQASLSIFWGLLGFAAMVVAARRQQREPWIAGAALMGVVVVKLFLVDTAGSGTLARIAAFLCVGALLLLTGYLSPLPPRAAERPPPT
ncbi:MAG: DUF2339 domain-containing protein [Nevskiaceae bacterium]|nr:MAG: DUF2339 domain-containing protein [Nevskiaceae bacterium]